VNIEGNTILITGGATGIGFALAEVLSKAGNEVVICGRKEDEFEAAVGNAQFLRMGARRDPEEMFHTINGGQ
jgi:short-subunit dehydrogenase involved in D-alanine esterification of teichoic acids